MANFDFAGYNSALDDWRKNPFGYEKPSQSSFYGTGTATAAPASSVPGAPSWVTANPFSASTNSGQVWDGTRARWVDAPASTNAGTLPASYTANPTPTSGAGAFGAVPGQLGLPEPGKNLAAQLPLLGNLNSTASSDILSQLSGELSPDVQASIQDAAARFGVTSGMPGSGLVANRTARDFGTTSAQLQQQGLANLNPFLSQTASTQVLSPTLQTQIAETNAQNAAAPDPTKAASYAKSLFDQYLASTQGRGTRISGGSGYSGGGPGGGSGAIPQFNSGGGVRGNSLGGNTGYDANGYPIASYAPGAFPGTNGGAIPQAQPYSGGYAGDSFSYNPNVLPNGGARYTGDPGVFGNSDYDILYGWGNNDFSG